MNLFKDKDLIKKDIEKFLKTHGTQIVNNSSKISTFFEISCYNYIIQFYENFGYEIEIANLIDGSFRYKVTPMGFPKNFSYFLIKKEIKFKGHKKICRYEIRQNIPVESKHDSNVFVTPDIVIFKSKIDSKRNGNYYRGKRNFYFVPNKYLISFAEAKHYNAFPELIINFTGIVNELKPSLLQKKARKIPSHIAPSLMISGKGTYQTYLTKKSLEKRYDINIFIGLFSWPSQVYAKQKLKNIIKI